jgi:hypothetical protein
MNLRFCIDGSAIAAALALTERRKITSLVVTDVDGVALGTVYLHDL